MEATTELRAATAPGVRPGRGLIRWVSNQNPFYVLSAALVLLGLRMSFDPTARVFPAWAFLLGLAGFTMLLAATACLLVRLGNVWDDVRTLLLLIVIVFLGISMIFDDILMRDRRLGLVGDVGGAAFAMALSEALLRGMRLRLPILFRLPYHLVLALTFLYPVALSPLLDRPDDPGLPWALLAFSTVAALVMLTLLPAIRRGPGYVRDNGSPWAWPLYPWSLFLIVFLGLCVRAMTLCWSMHAPGFPEIRESIFGLYFLNPLLLAGAWLLLEIGLVSRLRAVQNLALTVPPMAVVLALAAHGTGDVSQRFLGDVTDRLGGSPLFLTLLASCAFYGLAAWRRVPAGLGWLTAGLAALAAVGPSTRTLAELTAPQSWPLWTLTALHAARAWERPTSARMLVVSVFAAVAATLDLAPPWGAPARAGLALHLVMASALMIGLTSRDDLARFAQATALMLLALGSLVMLAAGPGMGPALAPEVPRAYPLLAASVALAYASVTHLRLAYASAATSLGLWFAFVGWGVYRQWRQVVVGLDHITWGLAFFALAALISLAKAGVLARWALHRKGKPYRPLG